VTLRVIGAGLARTGTMSLKIVLEQLLGCRCYHMFEVFANPDHIPFWNDAIRGDPLSWNMFLKAYGATVDLPAAACWRELAAANPDALVILSVRDSPEQWWDSVSDTLSTPAVIPAVPGTPLAALAAMVADLWWMRLGADDVFDAETMMAAYQRHNDAVRAQVSPARLLEWRPADGWAPIAAALGLPVPAELFPCVNTRAQFRLPDFGVRPETAGG
jgi:hypothetical protein